ncbi:MAG: AraC family ligand binding domain-containing protein, partial [Spirochaetia bacterium]|nr:AraC family ligand binding domain-containing protein [Spirochaetia bacterium]
MAQKNLIPHFLAVLGSAGRSLHDQFVAIKNPAFTTPDWDLLLVLKGEGGYLINQKKILVREGDLTLLKPGDHCVPFVVPGRRFDRFFMHFNIPLARDPGLIRRRLSRLSRVNVNGHAEIKHLCFSIMREIHEGAEGKLLANHYLSELLIRLVYHNERGVSPRLSRLEEKHSEKLHQVMA